MTERKNLYSVIDNHPMTNNIAISYGEEKITYKSLFKQSNKICDALLSIGLRKGEVVGVFLSKCPDYVATILGINKAGGVFMPLEIDYPSERLKDLISFVSPKFIVSSENFNKKLETLIPNFPYSNLLEINRYKSICREGVKINPEEKIYNRPNISREDSCYIIYTSGSTGQPKVIEGLHKSLSHFIYWEVNEFKLNSDTRTCLLAPISFDVSLRDIFVPLLSQGTLYIPDQDIKQPEVLVNYIKENKITLLHIVPTLFRGITNLISDFYEQGKKLESLDYILLAGEPLYGSDVNKWYENSKNKVELVNLYGPSETTLAKTFYRLPVKKNDPISIIPLGRPIPDTSILILNQSMKLCRKGEIGEIYIRTPFRSKGYFKSPDLTSTCFIKNPLNTDLDDLVYRTGDMGKYIDNHKIAFVGRKDFQIKIRGNRVELREVELAVESYPNISQSVVSPIVNGKDIALACYYTVESSVSVDSLSSYLSEVLPSYMVPSYYIVMNEFPVNINGKLNRRALPPPEDLLYDHLNYVAPYNHLQKAIANIWKDVLGLSKVGVNNSFFELGGNSLAATKVISIMNKELDLEMSFKEFFENVNIEDQELILRKGTGTSIS